MNSETMWIADDQPELGSSSTIIQTPDMVFMVFMVVLACG
jgi:hypothetical protein